MIRGLKERDSIELTEGIKGLKLLDKSWPKPEDFGIHCDTQKPLCKSASKIEIDNFDRPPRLSDFGIDGTTFNPLEISALKHTRESKNISQSEGPPRLSDFSIDGNTFNPINSSVTITKGKRSDQSEGPPRLSDFGIDENTKNPLENSDSKPAAHSKIISSMKNIENISNDMSFDRWGFLFIFSAF